MGRRQSGMLARYDGDCALCPNPIVAGQSRVVMRHGAAIHVGCAPGADDE